jgi:hypothetical protein
MFGKTFPGRVDSRLKRRRVRSPLAGPSQA